MSASTTPERTRTVSWDDPLISAQAAPTMSGLEFLQAMQRGELPPPPIMRLLNLGFQRPKRVAWCSASCRWFHSIHPPIQPHSNVAVPEKALFRSKRGHLIATRPFAPSDSGRIADLLAGLSAQSLFLRYCMPMPRMAPEMVARETARLGQHSPQQLTVVALAEVGGLEQAIAVAELARDATSPTVAEIALVVADAFQREGIGSALCAHLIALARRQGLAMLRATALAENAAVRRMVARSGVEYTAETRQGMTTIQIDLRNVGQVGRIALA